MKRQVLKFAAMLALGVFLVGSVDAQRSKRKASKKKTTAKKTTTVDPNANVAAPTPAPVNDSLPIAKPKPTLRSNSGASENNIKERYALPYDHIREEDKLYSQYVWREIDIREKMNIAFRNGNIDDQGDQRFVSILLRGIQNDEFTVFSDDRFSEPMTKGDVAKLLSGEAKSIQVPDWANDPTGATLKDSVIRNDFNADDVTSYPGLQNPRRRSFKNYQKR
jgi:hypothetical protein